MNRLLLFLVLWIGVAGCQQKPEAVYSLAAVREEAAPMTKQQADLASPPDEKPASQPVDKKKIIKDGQVGLRTDKLEETKKRVDNLVVRFNGYYASENFVNNNAESTYHLTIRIPSDRFEQFVAELETGSDELIYKNLDARDVTAEFIDLETRLANKRDYLERYRELLKQARTVKDIVDIEEKVRGLEEEIESAEGRLKYLSDQVSYSTLNLTISHEKDFTYQSGRKINFFEKLKQSLWKGWYGSVDFVLFLFRLWPLALLAALLLGLRKRWKSRKKK